MGNSVKIKALHYIAAVRILHLCSTVICGLFLSSGTHIDSILFIMMIIVTLLEFYCDFQP